MPDIETIPTQTAIEHLIEVARRKRHQDDTFGWEMAESVQAAANEKDPDLASRARDVTPSANTGLGYALADIHRELDQAGVPYKLDTLRTYYNTAEAWPEEDRVGGASYFAHVELAPREYEGIRKRKLRELVRQSAKGYVTRDQVRLWKSSRKPADMTPWEVKFEKRLKSPLISSSYKPRTEDEWQSAIRILRRVLAEAQAQLEEVQS